MYTQSNRAETFAQQYSSTVASVATLLHQQVPKWKLLPRSNKSSIKFMVIQINVIFKPNEVTLVS
ncbi:hypothetical protein WN51_11863 [Melipona quadrifasciata]|uniref:Uncharacterized protein n=1 Tax=Melipona quadrifasciata TaxID=166423 RepID=A0A0M9A3S3_9HYME|nr:hypothetical protein WN51_11863 [Melipona quadrifasciata]